MDSSEISVETTQGSTVVRIKGINFNNILNSTALQQQELAQNIEQG